MSRDGDIAPPYCVVQRRPRPLQPGFGAILGRMHSVAFKSRLDCFLLNSGVLQIVAAVGAVAAVAKES